MEDDIPEETIDFTEKHNKGILKPSLNDTYIILLKDNPLPSVYVVSEINESDNVVIMKSTSTSLILELDNEILLLQSTKLDYKILDIERVILFDLDILKKDTEQIDKQLTSDIIKDLDISLEEIKEKDIIYTEVEVKEELLSQLIYIYDAYNKHSLIQSITSFVDEYIDIYKEKHSEYLYNIHKNNQLPNWLIPIVDNPLALVSTDDEKDEFINSLQELSKNTGDYYQNTQLLLDHIRPVEPSLSELGFTSNVYSTKYLRDCLQTETCMGIQGNYRYDKRTNKRPFSVINDGDQRIIHQPDTLNITGLLYIPDNYLLYGLQVNNDILTLKEKNILQTTINSYSSNLHKLKELPILNKLLELDIDLSDINSLIHYTLSERLANDGFYELLKKIKPKIVDLLSELDTNVKDKLLNYEDIKKVFIKYDIDITKLSGDDKKVINELVTDNYKEYIKQVKSLSKIILKLKKKQLSIHQKIDISKKIIMNIIDIPRRNEYLQLFIKNFTREPYKTEDKLSLYNKYTNEKMICKHYLFSSMFHKDKSTHESMLSIYGKTPEDGIIYCKHCGEYLCNEEFSEFDGFNDEQPILLREEMKTNINLIDDFKESLVLLVKLIAKNIGVLIEDIDIKTVLDIYSTFNEDIIANTRYNTMNITNSDDHPMVQEINKHYKDKGKDKGKDKDKEKKNKIKEFQMYLKDTNKIVSITALLVIIIQTSIPTYNIKSNVNISLLEFNEQGEMIYTRKVLDYCIHKITKNVDLYKYDAIWNHFKLLTNEHKTYSLPTINEQLLNIVQYVISPQFPLIQERISRYKKFLQSSNQEFIKSEWTIFKPLRNNKLIKQIDTLIQDKESIYKSDYILNYNSYPIENVSLLEQIDANTSIYKILNIPISEIMINNAFLELFKICVSNYGISTKPIHKIDLHIERFLQTIKDKDEVTAIFHKHGFTSSLKKGKLSYKVLRTDIIPELLKHYQNTKQSLETCFSDEHVCNRFIHININNYDLFLLKTNPKRYYKYIPPTIYPDNEYDEISDTFKEKLFKRYKKDPSDKIIRSQLSDQYLDKFNVMIASDINISIPDIIPNYEKPLPHSNQSFKDILERIQTNILSLPFYLTPKIYSIDDYNIDIYKKNYDSEQRVLQVFTNNNSYDLGDDNQIIHQLSYYIKYIQSNSKIESVSIKKDLETAISSLTVDTFIKNISSFIYSCQSQKHKKRFENIFINTTESININEDDRQTLEGDGFRYKNVRETDIQKILELFSNDSKVTTDIVTNYIYRIRFILSNFSGTVQLRSRNIPKSWKLTETNKDIYKSYVNTNAFVLHKELFKLNTQYKAFYEYEDTYIFDSLLDYILPYMNDLDKLRCNEFSLLNEVTLFLINRYILLFIFDKLIEFHSKLQESDETIISLLETKLQKTSSDEELHLVNVIQTTELIIMDLITDLLQTHYDSRWIVSNKNLDTLSQRLGKQKEREKQSYIQKLEEMGDDKRAAATELQKMGITNQFKASSEELGKYVHSEERENASDVERYTMMNELFEGTIIERDSINLANGEIDESSVNPLIPIDEEQGYFNQDDIDEDGQMGDEYHEFYDEDLLDNNFNE